MEGTTRQAVTLVHSLSHAVFSTLGSITSSLPHVLQAHAHTLKTGQYAETYVANKLHFLYATHHCFPDAALVPHSIARPDHFSFSPLICSLSKSNFVHAVLRIVSRMLSLGHVPDFHVLPSAVKACAGLSALEKGREVHGIASVSGHASHRFVQISLFFMYMKCNQLRDAQKMFDKIPQPGMVIWNALLAGYARNGFITRVKQLFHEMLDSGFRPCPVSWAGVVSGFNLSGLYHEAVGFSQKMHSYGTKFDGINISSVLSAVGNLGELVFGTQIHAYAIKEGHASDKCIVTALITMYGRCFHTSEMSDAFDPIDPSTFCALVSNLSRNGLVVDALRAFARFRGHPLESDVMSWVSIIACCSQNGKDILALDLFREMQAVGVKPNSAVVACLLPACGNIAALMHGMAAHCFSIRGGVSGDAHVCCALIDMYANCGRIESARVCFEGMPIKNLASWNAMMNGYAMHGRAKEAIDVLHTMERSGQQPDSISFVCVLSACSHGGLIDKGRYYFNYMSREHGISARTEHHASLVTLLGRSGKLEEAYSVIKEMAIEPSPSVWGALLSSCRVHKNVELGQIAAEKLFMLEADNPGNYILLSNIYASKNMWNEVDRVRGEMRRIGLRKNPGCSWIEFKNEVHVILSGDTTHPQMTQVNEKMFEMSMEMKKSGSFPVSDSVLHDVEEQEKEVILCGHSEKIAAVLGLLNTAPRSLLRVIKNLRICADCHGFVKFISRFEGREILVRDTHRFHHFKDGACSCGDYW